MSFPFVTAPLESQVHHGVESPLHVLDAKPVPKLTGYALKTLTVTLQVEMPFHGFRTDQTGIGATADETKAATAAAMAYLLAFVAANTDAIMATGAFIFGNDTHFDYHLGLFTQTGDVIPQKYVNGYPVVPLAYAIWPAAGASIDFGGGARYVNGAMCSGFLSSIAPLDGGNYGAGDYPYGWSSNIVQARVTWMLFNSAFPLNIAIYRDGYSAPLYSNWINRLFAGPYNGDLNWPSWIGETGAPDGSVEVLTTGNAPADVSGVPFGQFVKVPFPPNTGWNAAHFGPHYTTPPTITPGNTVYEMGECYYPNILIA